VRAPHDAAAAKGDTAVRAAPEEPAADERFEWDADESAPMPPAGASLEAVTIRRGNGTPPEVPAEPTEPKAVRQGLPDAVRQRAPADEVVDEDDPPTMPRMVVSLIEEELEDEPPTNVLSSSPSPVPEEGSEPLSLEPEVDVAVARGHGTSPAANLSEEVAELQLLILRGFTAEATEAWRLLADAHPGHPDLEAIRVELGVAAGASASPPANLVAASDNTQPTVTPEITVVTRKPPSDDAPAPVETPTSPTFVAGTSPPPGGFAAASAIPRAVEPKVTPRLGIESPRRMHMPSSDSMPTNPRMSAADLRAAAARTAPAVRLVMLGTRGQSVWEQTLPQGGALQVGRDPMRPWGDDPHLEANHARLLAVPTGIYIEVLGASGVYRQVDERLAVRDGDEFRVGESLVRYNAAGGGWGALTWYPLSGEGNLSIPIGGAGILIGRENADIEIPEDTFVSGAHCRFSCRDDGLFVEDLGSANGTYTRVRSGTIVPFGGLVLVGQTQFKVRRLS